MLRGTIAASFAEAYVGDLVDREREQARDFPSAATVEETDFKRAVAAFGYEAAVLLDEDGRLLRVAPAAPSLLRSGDPLCVAIMDLDHSKRYNDTYGHQGGDRLLKETVAARRNTISIGVAAWDGQESADDLVARADTALYAAKEGGRDRYVIA